MIFGLQLPKESESISHSVVFNSLQLHGLGPNRLFCPWGSPGQEYWSGLPLPSPGDLPDPETELGSPALQADSLLSEPPGKPKLPKDLIYYFHFCLTSPWGLHV